MCCLLNEILVKLFEKLVFEVCFSENEMMMEGGDESCVTRIESWNFSVLCCQLSVLQVYSKCTNLLLFLQKLFFQKRFALMKIKWRGGGEGEGSVFWSTSSVLFCYFFLKSFLSFFLQSKPNLSMTFFTNPPRHRLTSLYHFLIVLIFPSPSLTSTKSLPFSTKPARRKVSVTKRFALKIKRKRIK